jgi:TolB-like protein/Tfp pilus assembly protein PilF/predicted Ser/Thr protein kinase
MMRDQGWFLGVINHKISHYRIIDKIGEGGMGVVYHAWDEKLHRDVALKFMPVASPKDKRAQERLVREARAASALNHPHICTIYEVDEADGEAYIAMEYVQGRPLSKQIPSDGLPAGAVTRYGAQIADALAHAHEHGVVHRDLKSSNILITPEGQVKVLDFGLAKRQVANEADVQTRSGASLTPAGAVVGTLHYIAPEVFRGEPADARSDIWALGVVLYEMAAGKRPFEAHTAYELGSAILREPPAPLATAPPPALCAMIERCLAKEPGQRYQHASEVRAALEAIGTNTASISLPPTAPVPTGLAARALSRRSLLMFGAVVGASLLVLVGLKLAQKGRGGGSGKIQSLAVLPLENLSGDAKQDYFADGMTDALITELSQVRALRVISRTSVMQYKGVRKPIPQIARELHVDAVVEGSVVRSGDRVRISAELIQAANEQNLWAQKYERDFSDVLALQSDVASAIVGEIQIKLTQQEQTRLVTTRPVVPAAYDAYLQGRDYASKRTGDALSQSLRYFQQAIKLDPTYAPAYAGLADTYALLSDYGSGSPTELLPKAEEAANKAVQLDDNLAEAHASLGHSRYSHLEWAGVASEYQRAIELNPGYAPAHHWYAIFLAETGREEEGLAEIALAEELDPRSQIISANVAWCYYLAGRYDQAIEQARKTIELNPSFPGGHEYLAQAYLEKGMYQETFEEFQKALSLSRGETPYQAELANAYAAAGRKQDARRMLQALLELSRHQYVSPYSLAFVYAGLGDKDQVFDWLNKAYEERSVHLMSIQVHPRFASLRSDPRFEALVRRIGLPEIPRSAVGPNGSARASFNCVERRLTQRAAWARLPRT